MSTSSSSSAAANQLGNYAEVTGSGFKMNYLSYTSKLKQTVNSITTASNIHLDFVLSRSDVIHQTIIYSKQTTFQLLTSILSTVVSLFSLFLIFFSICEYVFGKLNIDFYEVDCRPTEAVYVAAQMALIEDTATSHLLKDQQPSSTDSGKEGQKNMSSPRESWIDKPAHTTASNSFSASPSPVVAVAPTAATPLAKSPTILIDSTSTTENAASSTLTKRKRVNKNAEREEKGTQILRATALQLLALKHQQNSVHLLHPADPALSSPSPPPPSSRVIHGPSELEVELAEIKTVSSLPDASSMDVVNEPANSSKWNRVRASLSGMEFQPTAGQNANPTTAPSSHS